MWRRQIKSIIGERKMYLDIDTSLQARLTERLDDAQWERLEDRFPTVAAR